VCSSWIVFAAFPQSNGDVFAFDSEINNRFEHGVPKASSKTASGPRFSIIAWGRRRSMNVRNGGDRTNVESTLTAQKKQAASSSSSSSSSSPAVSSSSSSSCCVLFCNCQGLFRGVAPQLQWQQSKTDSGDDARGSTQAAAAATATATLATRSESSSASAAAGGAGAAASKGGDARTVLGERVPAAASSASASASSSSASSFSASYDAPPGQGEKTRLDTDQVTSMVKNFLLDKDTSGGCWRGGAAAAAAPSNSRGRGQGRLQRGGGPSASAGTGAGARGASSVASSGGGGGRGGGASGSRGGGAAVAVAPLWGRAGSGDAGGNGAGGDDKAAKVNGPTWAR
jgi:hypothetical protein